MTHQTVAVLGGGIAGLTTADELRRRGFEVTVFEATGTAPKDLGGKARSFEDHGDPAVGPMFGEHGFRFFPGFYEHVITTMEEIPDGRGGHVSDELHQLSCSAFYARLVDGADDAADPPTTDHPRGAQRVTTA